MLSDFITENRHEIILRCRVRVSQRRAPGPTEIEDGIATFLDQLAVSLRTKLVAHDVGVSATAHGGNSERAGLTISQLVNDYGDTCQAITGLAIERSAAISAEEFRALNLCLDEAVAVAVTEFARKRELAIIARRAASANEELGYFAHELRNLLGTATLAFEVLAGGTVGISGSTGVVLRRSLLGLAKLIDRSLVIVRLDAGIRPDQPIATISEIVEEVQLGAALEAKVRGHRLTIEQAEPKAELAVDREVLGTVLANLLQNAFKYSRAESNIVLRTWATQERVTIEVEDECGGLPPGSAATMFEPFEQRHLGRGGLGLGLAICLRGVRAIGGTLIVRDLPGKGCVFVVELPRVVRN